MARNIKKKQRKTVRKKTVTELNAPIIRRIMDSDLSMVRVIGGTVYDNPESTGWDKLVPPYLKDRRESIITGCVNALEERRRDWISYIFVFHLDDDDVQHLTVHDSIIPNVYPNEIDAVATKELDNLWFEAEQKTKLSTAWMVVPDVRHKLETEYKDLMQKFQQDGCWDREVVKRHVDARMKNNIKIKIIMDTFCIDWAISNEHLKQFTIHELTEKVAYALTYVFIEETEVVMQIGENPAITIELPDMDEDTHAHAKLVLAKDFTQASSLDNNIMFNVLRLADNEKLQENKAFRKHAIDSN